MLGRLREIRRVQEAGYKTGRTAPRAVRPKGAMTAEAYLGGSILLSSSSIMYPRASLSMPPMNSQAARMADTIQARPVPFLRCGAPMASLGGFVEIVVVTVLV